MVWGWATCSIVPGSGEGMDKRFYCGLKIHIRTIDKYCMYSYECITRKHVNIYKMNIRRGLLLFFIGLPMCSNTFR